MDFYCLESSMLGIVVSLPPGCLKSCKELSKNGHLRKKLRFMGGPWGWLWEPSVMFVIPLLMRLDLAGRAGWGSFPSPHFSEHPSPIWVHIFECDLSTWRRPILWSSIKVAVLLFLRLSKRQSGERWKPILLPITKLHAKKQKLIHDLCIRIDSISWKSS